MKKIKVLQFITLILLSFVWNIAFVSAKELVEITNVQVKEKSDTLTADNLSFHNNEVLTPITFNQKNDYILLEVTLKNNTEDSYYISSVENNINKEFISVELEKKNTTISKNSESKIFIKLKVDKGYSEQNELVINDGFLTINYRKLTNPITSSTRLVFMVVMIILLTTLLIKTKKKKFLLVILSLPILVLAKEELNVKLKFNNITINKNECIIIIIINSQSSQTETRILSIGDQIGFLPTVSKKGYTFEGWENEEGELIEENYQVESDLIISPRLIPIQYQITYDLDGGTVSESNPTTYTIEDEIVLNNPTKARHQFVGWTAGASSDLLLEVVIPKGSIGDRRYTANYELKTTAKYTVIHRRMDLNGAYTIISRNTFEGEIDSNVTPSTMTYTGFTSPATQTKKILEDGSTTFTYDYERLKYSWSYSGALSSTVPAGMVYYGTSISLTGLTGPWDSYHKYYEKVDTISITVNSKTTSHSGSYYTFTLTGNTSASATYCLSGEMEVEVYDKKKKKRKKKKLKDIGPDDLLLAWDFDNGCYDYVEPSFIMKKTKAYEHHILRFSDGSELDVVGEHRMYDVDRKIFVDCIADSPMGTRTINNKGKIIELISRQKVDTEVEVCRVITKKHFNFFANGILTSVVLNNLYPIEDMKYVKEERNAIKQEDLNVDEYTFKELRFSEIDENFKGYLESTQSFLNYYAGVLNNGMYERNDNEEETISK